MKLRILSATLASGLCLGSFGAFADSHGMTTMQLAEQKKCMACHTTSEELPRAPAFTSIAQRYTMEDEYDRLVQVVLTGGEDHWGSAEMPEMDARAEVSQEEAERLVKWIFDMKE